MRTIFGKYSISILTTFIDYTKAIDTVNHRIMLEKLEKSRISGKAHRWIKSYFVTGTVCECQRNSLNKLPIVSGVPQGSNYWPASLSNVY